MFDELTDEELGEVLRAIMSYQAGRDIPELSHCSKAVFAQVKMQFAKDDKKYNETLEKRKEASKMGVEARKQKQPHGNHMVTNGNQTVGDSDSDSVSDSECVSDSENHRKENVLTDIREKSPQEQAFDEFWAMYPKKKSKGQAKRAWDKIKPDKDTIMAIMAKLPELMASDDWQKENGRYIPYPATWLNAEGWKDEVSRPKNRYEVIDEWARASSQY
ncbi:MAG: DUF6291 domain-containing protein [Bacteroidales bacterium]|nr:DUF6291 domain-containing protein [Bacteroidales bacterium]